MARQYGTRHPDTTHTSIGDSTMSDFDPEHEAFASTRQLENSERLPDLPSSIKRHRPSPRPEPDYTIDTSTLQRAFPEFSEVETSGEDDEEDISIEVGRGVTKSQQHRLDDSRNSMISFENGVRSPSPAVKLDYPATSTPPKSAMRTASKRMTGGGDLRKDAQIRRASQVQKENLDPQPSRLKNTTGRQGEARRTLSEMHARARETYDGSYVGDERPHNVPTNTRATRFGNVSAQIAAAVDQAAREALMKETRRAKQVAIPTNGTYAANTYPDGTHQSFLLPDLPNLSELVSGVYEDGSPVYTRQAKARSTRFVSPAEAADVSQTRGHLPLDAVPIPEDEKVLFVSLKLLQEKVADLESAKSEIEKKLEDVRQENLLLRADKSRRQREQYDRLKMFGGEEGDYGRGSRSILERNKLDAANLDLQNRLDIAERKIQVHENALRSLSQERDAAVSQLGVAYLNTQDTKKENETLKRENTELKAQLARLSALSRELAGNKDTRHTDAVTIDTNVDDPIYTQRTVESTRLTHEQSHGDRRSTAAPADDPRAKISSQIDKEMLKIEKERQDEELFSLNLSQPTHVSTRKASRSVSHAKTENADSSKLPNTGKQRVKRVVVEDVDLTDSIQTELPTEDVRKQVATDKDLTLLSFIDDREIAQLRKRLEEERAARKQRQSLSLKEPANITSGSRRLVSDPPRKSSLKESKDRHLRPTSAAGENTATGRTTLDATEDQDTVRRRRHSDHSVTSQSRRRNMLPELTSAFIIPDITFRHTDTGVHEPARLSDSAQKVLDKVARHDGHNCTVCRRLLPKGVTHDHQHGGKRETITVPKPIPVSERMPDPSVYNEEPTLRPAQPPALALATVLKSLEDELSHLKIQLATYQDAYAKHDASLSRRQRKSLSQKIERLLRDIDTKADQIYALYDVLEGQKQDGQEMTEKEIEVTLQSIGIDFQSTHVADLTGATDESVRKDVRTQDDIDDDDDDDGELPWEGIESTAEFTGRSIGSRRTTKA